MTAQVLREVRLYGVLGRNFGRSHRLAVDTPAEAVQALCVLFKGFRKAVLAHDGPGFHVLVGAGHRLHDRGEHELLLPVGDANLIRIVPVTAGAKSAWATVILGAALLVFAPYAAGFAFGAGASVGVSVGISTYGVAIGKALVLSGVVQLLSPQRAGGGGARAENVPSYSFNGAVNTNQAGGPVPLIIGRMVVGSTTVSAGLSAEDLVPPPAPPAPAPPPRPIDMPADPYLYSTP